MNLEQDSVGKLQALEVQVKNLTDKLDKIENDKYTTTNHDIIYLKEVVEFQNAKLEKLTNLVNDFLKGDNHNLLLSSIQENDVNVNDQVNQVQDQVEQQVRQHVALVPATTVAAAAAAAANNNHHHSHHHHSQVNSHVNSGQGHPHSHVNHGHLNNQHNPYKSTDDLQTTLDSNIHPELHVAQPTVTNAGTGQATNDLSEFTKATTASNKSLKRKQPSTSSASGAPPMLSSNNGMANDLKRPKIIIDFIHNPMTVKEIYDEYTKGFRGQPPLCELDEKYGKSQWRGDSRSKESKRFQRRKRLCDAISKGMAKYNKSAEEIISYIEEFRGDKSLTWVMNGNLPEDLLI